MWVAWVAWAIFFTIMLLLCIKILSEILCTSFDLFFEGALLFLGLDSLASFRCISGSNKTFYINLVF